MFLICMRCGKKIGLEEPKITLAEGYRCSSCEYDIQMGRGQMTLEDKR